MTIKPSSITSNLPNRSPSPLSRRSQAKADGGEGQDEGELNICGYQSALTFIPASKMICPLSQFGACSLKAKI
jgi:hypothetical protein